MSALTRIGRIVCSEMSFSRFLNIVPVSFDRSTLSMSDDRQYLSYLQTSTINGVVCEGGEERIKECRATMNADLDTTNLYELDVECACKFGRGGFLLFLNFNSSKYSSSILLILFDIKLWNLFELL